jgi:hypothetical protein
MYGNHRLSLGEASARILLDALPLVYIAHFITRSQFIGTTFIQEPLSHSDLTPDNPCTFVFRGIRADKAARHARLRAGGAQHFRAAGR